MRKLYSAICVLVPVLVFLLVSVAHAVGILTTKHNLSASGPGPVRAVSETQVCVFCHTPHRSTRTPLWNHNLSSASYVLISSPTMKTVPENPPDGDSRLCLSCHDGTVAIGSVVNLGGVATTISMQGGGSLTPGGMLSSTASGYIGTDLSGHHPVSIEVDNSLINDKGIQCDNSEVSFRLCYPHLPVKLRPTANLYGGGPHTNLGVQCTSCHDAHDDPIPGTTKFLREGTPSDTTDLCIKCHISCSMGCQ